jgi:hypothetical protein
MPQYTPQASGTTRETYGMGEQLRLEAENKDRAGLLFAVHTLEDISSELSERKSGTDFLLTLRNHDGSTTGQIRCENKFDQYTTGRAALELVSVDTDRVAGWMYTSQCGWLLYWHANTGDLFAFPMDELRALVMDNVARHKSTTCKNKRYLSWSVLEDVNYLLQNCPNARFLDLRYELGDVPKSRSKVYGAARSKLCTSDALVEHMRQFPFSTNPRPYTTALLEENMKQLAPLNLKAEAHADRIARLPFLARPAA